MRSHRVALLLCVAAFVAGTSNTAGQIGAAAPGMQALLGVWVPDAAPRALLTSRGTTPPLTAEGAKLYTERRQRLAKGDASFDPTTWCAGPGMPRILTMPYPLEIRADASRIALGCCSASPHLWPALPIRRARLAQRLQECRRCSASGCPTRHRVPC